MYTCNVTLVVSAEKERELIEYIREEFVPEVVNRESGATEPELKKVVEAGGEKPGPEHGLSLALSVKFATEETAHHWHDTILLPSLDKFRRRFGEHALFFVTLLENIVL